MHGSSSVPKDLIDVINEFGGSIPETYGVPIEEIQRGIKSGVRKVNIDTDNRLAITAAVRRALAEKPEEFDPRHFLKPSIKEMQKVCAERYNAFGCAGNGTKIKMSNLDEMAAKYASGELSAKVAVTCSDPSLGSSLSHPAGPLRAIDRGNSSPTESNR